MSKTDVAALTDEQIVEIVRSQDQEMYRHLIGRYENPLLRYVLSFVPDESAAADVLQEVFIKAFINLNGFKTNKKFSSWIYRIAHNESLNHIKRYGREVQVEDDWLDQRSNGQADLAEVLDLEIRKEELNSALKTLDIKYREPVFLFYFEGKSYEDISDILQLPTSSVGTRIKRAKNQLRDILEKQGIKDG